MLRIMTWLYTNDGRLGESRHGYQIDNGQMCIVTGPNIDMAIKLIKRMKGLSRSQLQISFQNKETVLELNGYSIEAYPSNHIDAFRTLDNVKFIFLDEVDMFRKTVQDEVWHVSERNVSKSNLYLQMRLLNLGDGWTLLYLWRYTYLVSKISYGWSDKNRERL